MKIIGITGRMGTGKSTVARMLQELGAAVIDADKLGHLSYEPGSETYHRLVSAFGEGILDGEGRIERSKLAQKAFADPSLLKLLNQITHPAIRNLISTRLDILREEGCPIAVVEAALLPEAGWKELVDEVWLTRAPEQLIRERLRAYRGFATPDIEQRLNYQLPQEALYQYADVIIDTSCSLEELREEVLKLYKKRLLLPD